MQKKLISTTILLVIVATVLIFVYRMVPSEGLLAVTITFVTTSYHFVMRLFVGAGVNGIMHNHADYEKKWYQVGKFEENLYEKLQVKKWKDRMPTYSKDTFSMKKRTIDEIVQATCQSEITHEVIAVLSFLPILASLKFDSFMVFFITSVLAACFDLSFVVIQRYNRPRLVKMVKKMKKE